MVLLVDVIQTFRMSNTMHRVEQEVVNVPREEDLDEDLPKRRRRTHHHRARARLQTFMIRGFEIAQRKISSAAKRKSAP